MDEEPFWQSIKDLGVKRGAIITEQLGVRTVSQFATLREAQIADALEEQGQHVGVDTIRRWLERAVDLVSDASAGDADRRGVALSPIRTAVFQPVDDPRVVVEHTDERSIQAPLRAHQPLLIEMEFEDPDTSIELVLLQRIGCQREGRPERFTAAPPVATQGRQPGIRTVAYGLPDGLFQILLQPVDGGLVRAGKLQLVEG